MNLDKQEYVCPWCLGGGAKLWEWAANTQGGVFTLLLRKSDRSGGGDYYGYPTQEIHIDSVDRERAAETVIDAVLTGVAREGRPVAVDDKAVVGRWAGDRVALVGDYDSSQLWDELDQFRNISAELVVEWNKFIELEQMKLKFNPGCGCGQGGA